MSSSSLKDRTWSQQQTQKLTRALARSTAVDQNIMRSPAPPPDVKACAVASDTGMADGTLDMEGEDVSEDPESSDAQAEALFESSKMAKSLGSLIALPEELRYEVYYYALLEASPHGSILRPASVHTKKASGSDNRPTPAEIASIVDGQGVSGLMRVAKTQKTAPLLLVSKKVSAEAMRVRQQVQKVRLIANGITSMELLFNHAGLCHPTLRNILGHRHFEIIWPQREGIRLYTFIEAIRSFLYDICDREKILVFNSGLRTIKGVLNCTPTGPGDQHIRDVMAILNEKQDSELQMLEEGDSEAEEGSGASKFSIRLSLPRYPQTDYRWYAWEQGPSRGTRSDGEHPEFAAWVSKFENYVKRVGQAQARDEVKAAHDASSSPST